MLPIQLSQGTTTNNRFLLNFKTGAFLAGLPVRPVIIKYDLESPVSLCWDTINVLRHVALVLLQPWHRVTCYEVSREGTIQSTAKYGNYYSRHIACIRSSPCTFPARRRFGIPCCMPATSDKPWCA